MLKMWLNYILDRLGILTVSLSVVPGGCPDITPGPVFKSAIERSSLQEESHSFCSLLPQLHETALSSPDTK